MMHNNETDVLSLTKSALVNTAFFFFYQGSTCTYGFNMFSSPQAMILALKFLYYTIYIAVLFLVCGFQEKVHVFSCRCYLFSCNGKLFFCSLIDVSLIRIYGHMHMKEKSKPLFGRVLFLSFLFKCSNIETFGMKKKKEKKSRYEL